MLTLEQSKIISMVALGLGSFLIGILPLKISSHGRTKWPLVISVLLCFGAGVLLATSIIHMLPEVRVHMKKYAELTFCMGFFLVYLLDELVHYFCGETIGHSHPANVGVAASLLHEHAHNHNHTEHSHNHQIYGSIGDPAADPNSITEGYNRQLPYNPSVASAHRLEEIERNVSVSSPSCCAGESSNARICHVSHKEPCNNSPTGRFGLLAALSLHALLEGLAIGLEQSAPKVMLLLGAVASHKFVVGFCLGLELSANAVGKTCSTIVAILVFSLGSAAGIGVGMAIADLNESITSMLLPILQGLAGGTLLHVTVSEVLPRERSRWHQKRSNPGAGLAQYAAVSVGFAAMTLLNFLLGD